MSVLEDFAEEEVVENPTLRAAYNLAPLHQNEPLHWNYDVNLIGEKIYDKTIHLCEICELPILVFGRLLPCKHVFCFDCALRCDKTCKRCQGKVQKMEKSALGTVYICTFGAPKHNIKGCRRTYLSQRDLLSHHAHRHLDKPSGSSSKQQSQLASSGSTGQPASQLVLAQQQAGQQKSQPLALASRGLMSPSQSGGGVAHNMGGVMLSSSPAQSSPLIPGLGNLPAGMGGQASPHLQASVSPKLQLQQQGMAMSYTGQSGQQGSADIYKPLDMPAMVSNPLQQQTQQQHRHMLQSQQQQGLHMASVTHMQQGSQGMQPSFGQPGQFQGSTSLVQQQQQQQQQMGMNPGQPTLMATGMHPNSLNQQQQQHQGVPASLGMDLFSQQNSQQASVSSAGMQMTMSMANASQSRTNVNLITVPIQDEGQYRQPPFVNTSMMNQAKVQVSSFNSQARGNPGTHTQSFPQHNMSAAFSPQLSTGAQSQNMISGGSDQSQGMSFNQSQGNPQGINFSQTGAQNMGLNFNQSGGQAASPRLGFNQPGMQQGNSPGIQAFNQGLRMNQLPRMPGGAGSSNMPRGLANVVQAINMAAAVRAQGVNPVAGMIPSAQGLPAQNGGGNNRFTLQGGHWPSPHGLQPRMGSNQSQSRSHDGSFNQGPYYS